MTHTPCWLIKLISSLDGSANTLSWNYLKSPTTQNCTHTYIFGTLFLWFNFCCDFSFGSLIFSAFPLSNLIFVLPFFWIFFFVLAFPPCLRSWNCFPFQVFQSGHGDEKIGNCKMGARGVVMDPGCWMEWSGVPVSTPCWVYISSGCAATTCAMITSKCCSGHCELHWVSHKFMLLLSGVSKSWNEFADSE